MTEVTVRALATITELAERWHRASESYQQNESPFTAGRMVAYAQAIQLLLGVASPAAVVEALEKGDI